MMAIFRKNQLFSIEKYILRMYNSGIILNVLNLQKYTFAFSLGDYLRKGKQHHLEFSEDTLKKIQEIDDNI